MKPYIQVKRGKSVIWTELDAERVEIKDLHPWNDTEFSLSIKHPDAGRVKIFKKSRAGNWVYVGLKDRDSGIKQGYIIKDDLGHKLFEVNLMSFKQAQAQYNLMYPKSPKNDAIKWFHGLIRKQAIKDVTQ